jgi:Legionella pneumophila major outer membrane protein precursor
MNKMQHSRHGLRIALLAGASVVALAAAAPTAGAADLNKPTLTKAPPPIAPLAKDTWTWWIEGGAFNTGGGNIGLPAFKPNWGGEGAVGFDWQPFAPMHVVGQFRYGAATRSRPLSASFVSGPTTISLNGTQSLREDHWLVDFGIGRDFGLGNTHAMWTLGIRVADLRSKLNASGTFAATSGGSPVSAGAFAFQERTSFIGAGPRFGVQGDIPLGNQWSIDWLAGAAVLFGERQVSATAPGGGIGVGVSDSAAIFNVDAQAGLSYWFTPTTKITASYRFDEYFRALKTLNASTAFTTAGPTITSSNLDRSFSGPMLRLTSKF